MKCIDCIRILPPHKGPHGQSMPNQGQCPDDPSGTTKSLRYERQCEKFRAMTDTERIAKRAEWEKILNPPKRAKQEEEDESSN